MCSCHLPLCVYIHILYWLTHTEQQVYILLSIGLPARKNKGLCFCAATLVTSIQCKEM